MKRCKGQRNLRKKLLVMNLFMIVIPCVTFLLSAVIFWEGAGVQYEESAEALIKDSNLMYSAQGFLHAYWEEVREQEDFPQTVVVTERMRKLEQSMDQIGYHFQISVDGQDAIGNLTAEEEAAIRKINADQPRRFSMTEDGDGTVILIQSAEKNGTEAELAAIHTPEHMATGHYDSIWMTFLKYILWAVALVGCSIVFSNIYLSFWIRHNILEPLRKLSAGSHKIKNGEFDFKIENEKQDEIGEVCRDFDAMSVQLKKAEEARLRYERDRAELFAGISHDLRSPLTSIKGYAEGLMEGIANTPEKREKYYKAIHRRAHDMEYLVNRLGSYMSLETGKYEFHMVRQDLNRYLKNDIEKYIGMEMLNQGVEVTFHLTQQPLIVKMDEEQMYRVFDNIIQNSMKYRVHETVHIVIETAREDAMAFVRIGDDGDGVPEEKLPYLFDCFYRADSSRTRPERGSGLGLSIVRQIITGHHGIIKAENDGGLSILIWLPIAEAGEEPNEKDTDR